VPRPTTTGAPASRSVALSDGDNGKTVSAHVGDTITVVLHSTYWKFNPPSAPSVVAPQGSATVAPDMHGCVPGGGCGTVTMNYRATGRGTSTISAHRDSCGEAMRCTGTAGDWAVTVTVS